MERKREHENDFISGYKTHFAALTYRAATHRILLPGPELFTKAKGDKADGWVGKEVQRAKAFVISHVVSTLLPVPLLLTQQQDSSQWKTVNVSAFHACISHTVGVLCHY